MYKSAHGTKFYNSSFNEQRIIENCKFLFGDVDPVILTERGQDGGEFVNRVFKIAHKSLKLKEIQKDVEEKLQRLTVDIEDSEVKEGLRRQLIDRARASIARKEEKRKTEVAKKIQDILDTIEDDDDDDDEMAMERLLLQVQEPSTNPKSSAEIDWRGECVSNILRDCQKKFRQKLREQKEDLTAKLDAEKKDTVDSMNAERAIADAEKEAVIGDLKEKFDAKGQALERACTDADCEKGFRQKLEDALDVLRDTEDERKQDLIRIKMESERRREKIKMDTNGYRRTMVTMLSPMSAASTPRQELPLPEALPKPNKTFE
ncbi:Protein of unknown function [Pyronema omphalodes CBS 100304]|uniref:Uncharacterized protein n=1 Tax=Pyronema omphalodes (strain CBS 100304) TaxID=1076935 RepID=U4L0Y5_PYROM|nr:Protein of unknown function [Pyronema omphalodes CBS 100304]